MNKSPSLSALLSYSASQEVTASNLANVNTDGFKAKRMEMEDLPEHGGVRPQDVVVDSDPRSLRQREKVVLDDKGNLTQTTEMVESSNTDVSREMVRMIENTRAIEANARALRAIEENTGHILNLLV